MLSFEEDEYTLALKEGEGRWYVVLNNGQKVYQDDERPHTYPHSTWLRLQEYCRLNKLYITAMYLQFRSHTEAIEADADGYFFSKSAMSGFGMNRTFNYFLIGTIKHNTLTVNSWKLPELIVNETEIRDINKSLENIIFKD